MGRNGRVLLCGMILCLLPGCAMTGKWSLTSVTPTAARRHFDYQSLTFQKDGSFYAEEQERGIKTTSGVYKYEGNTLTLKPHDGEDRSYQAELKGNELILERIWEDQTLTAVFERRQ